MLLRIGFYIGFIFKKWWLIVRGLVFLLVWLKVLNYLI